MVVQLDPLPDDRQDWLVRPIWRRDLLLAKLLFVILFLHLPMLLADTLQGVASGFPLDQTLAAAAKLNLSRLIAFTLPALAIGALTRSIGQMLGLGLVVFIAALAVIGGATLALEFFSGGFGLLIGDTLAGFVLGTVLLLGGMATILGLQYFRRTTMAGRLLLGATIILGFAAQILMPESPAYALENWLASAPGQALDVSFAPQAGRFPAGVGMPDFVRRGDGQALVLLPLSFAGIPPGREVVAENIHVALIGADGKPLGIDTDDTLLQPPSRPGAPAYVALHLGKELPSAYADRPMRLELYLVLSNAAPGQTTRLPADGEGRLIPGVGRCVTRSNKLGTGVEIGCQGEGPRNVQTRFALVDKAGNSLATSRWSAHDGPSGSFDLVSNETLGLSFADPDALPHPMAAVTVTQPGTRVVRHLTIPAIRLNDWKADAPKTAP